MKKSRFTKTGTDLTSLYDKAGGASKESASLFYYLNRTCYNGLCRFNSNGLFNVPFGSYKNINYRTDFTAYSERLSEYDFSNVDFEEVEAEEGDFVYADPPYDVEFVSYSPDGFKWQDQQRLARHLAKHNGPVVVSNQATPPNNRVV